MKDNTTSRTLGSVAKYINGRAFKPSEWEDIGLPIIRIQNLTDQDAPCNFSQLEFEEKYKVRKGDLLFAWSASLGAHIWRGGNAWLNQHIFKVEPHSETNKMYLYYFLKKIVADLYSKTHGSGMVHITKEPFMATLIPLPPLPEQDRIVARIEELFSELDKGVEALQTIKAQLKVYRQAVLKEAFEGKLEAGSSDAHEKLYLSLQQSRITLGNRNQYSLLEQIDLPDLPSEWHWICVGDVISSCSYGTSSKSSESGKVPVIRMGNLQNGVIDWDDLAYTSDEAEIEKYKLYPYDVLFNRTNSPEWVGKTAIYKGERPAIYAGYLIRINYLQGINPQYLAYFLNSPIARAYGKKVKTDGVNQSNINATKLCTYPFPLCGKITQDKIVGEIESRLSVCDKIEQTVDVSLAKAESLRQSILKKAFEGRLI